MSHNRMSCFFSGQDQDTLREEGNDRNCFVSLIVNNAGTYCAAVTRKRQTKKRITTEFLGDSYQFFGQGAVYIDGSKDCEITEQIDSTTIEYFMLDIEVEKVDNPLNYLDTRFEEIEAKKKAATPQIPKYPVLDSSYTKPEETDQEFFDWLHSERNESVTVNGVIRSEPTIFDSATMVELIDASKWNPDPTIIHYLVCQLVTCSLIVDNGIDVKQWITRWMKKKYDTIFSDANGMEFSNWSESYVEFIVGHYSDEDVPKEVYEDLDLYQGKIAEAIADELMEYPSNDYISIYMDVLDRYAN